MGDSFVVVIKDDRPVQEEGEVICLGAPCGILAAGP
jgi:hypothetical protein